MQHMNSPHALRARMLGKRLEHGVDRIIDCHVILSHRTCSPIKQEPSRWN